MTNKITKTEINYLAYDDRGLFIIESEPIRTDILLFFNNEIFRDVTIYCKLEQWLSKPVLECNTIGSIIVPSLFFDHDNYNNYSKFIPLDFDFHDKMWDTKMLSFCDEEFMRILFRSWVNDGYADCYCSDVEKRASEFLKNNYRKLIKEATIKEVIE